MAEMKKLRPDILAHPHVSDEIKTFNNELEKKRNSNLLSLGKLQASKVNTFNLQVLLK